METYLQAKSVFARLLGAYLLQVVLLLLATGRLVNAQAPVIKGWDKTVGGGNTDQLHALVATADGGFLLGGSSTSNAGGDKSQNSKGFYDYLVVKIDASGTKVWDSTLGGAREDKLTSILATADGGFLLGGSSTSNAGGDKSQNSKGFYDYWVVKINGNGTKVWDKTWGGISDDKLTSMVATADGGFLLGGSSNSGVGYDKSQPSKGDYDFWIVKIDASGTKVWDKTLGGGDFDQLTSMVATADGGFLLGGSSLSSAGSDKSQDGQGGYDYWVVKIDFDGTKVWDTTLGAIGIDELTSMVATDGGFLLGGSSNGNYWVVKINASGTKVWDKFLQGFDDNRLTAMGPTVDGGFLLGGYSNSNKGADKSEDSKGDYDYWVVKIDGNGTKVWDKTLGGLGSDQLTSLVATADRGYLLGGYSNSNSSGDKSQDSKGADDYWVVQLQECNQPAAQITATSQTLSCAVSSVTLTASVGSDPAAYTYQWNTGATIPSITVTEAGEYSVQVSTKEGCAIWVRQTISVVDKTVPTASLTASGELSCANPSVTLTAGAIEGAIYRFSGGATQLNGGNTATVSQAGTYSVVVSSPNGCTASASVAVSGSSTPPTASLTANSELSCANPSITLTATPSEGVTYIFSGGATQVGQGNTATVTQSGSYSVIVTSPNGCTASASVAVSGNPTTSPHPDYQPLVDLYNSTNGVSWTNKTGWLSGCDPCGWYGVSCSQGRVTGLDLHNNDLRGSLPTSLGNLANLQVLNLQSNQLSGSLPASLGNLTNLQQLLLNINQLSGSIPASLGNLANLQLLYLQHNQLSGSIPGSLGNLTKLQQFLLNINQLSGSIPASLGSLTNLYYLLLSDNQLSSSIPGSLGSLTKLQQLTLFNNQLNGSIPASLGSLTNLRTLLLQNNQLSGCYPASLTALCGIASKDFSANTGLPGGGSAQALAAFCATGRGGDGFVPTLMASGQLSCANPSVTLTAGVIDGATYAFSPGATPLNGSNTATVSQAGTYSVVVSSPYGCSASASVNVASNVPTIETILYVKQGASGSGASWDCALGDLQAAITLATAGQQIWVAAGEYQPAANQSFIMKEGVKIYGGFAPTGTPAFTDRNWAQNVTILKGNNSHVVYNDYNGLTNAALLDGFTLTGGSAQTGGGVFNDGAYPLINHCVFKANQASQWGGGIYNAGAGTTTVANCLFYQNSAQSGGAVFSNLNATPRFINVTIVNNTAEQNGGAVHNYQNAQTELINTIVWANHQAIASSQLYSSESGKTNASFSILDGGAEAIIGEKALSEVSSLDPLFVDATPSDYRLQACSPAINDGTSSIITGELTTDLAGNNRIYGEIVDLGAYEYQASGGGPRAGLSASGSISCTTPSVILTASPNSGVTYAFSGGATQLNGGNTATVSQAGTYSVVVSLPNGCSASASVAVIGSSSPPTASLSASGELSCAHPTVTLTATPTPGATYAFSPGATQINGGNTATVSTLGTYSVVVTTPGGCSASASTLVIGNIAIPNASIAAPNKTLSCNNTSLQLSASGGSDYRWNTGATGFDLTVSEAGVYSVTVSSPYSCTASTSVTIISDTTPPLASLSANGPISCASPSVTLTSTPTPGATYAFSSRATQMGVGNTATVSQAGAYSVVVTGANGCTASASISVSAITQGCSTPVAWVKSQPLPAGSATGIISLTTGAGGYAPGIPFLVSYVTPTSTTVVYTGLTTNTGSTTNAGEILITGLQAGNYGPFVVSINGNRASAPSNTVSLLDPAPVAWVKSRPLSVGSATGIISLTTGSGGYAPGTPVSVSYVTPTGTPVVYTGLTTNTGSTTNAGEILITGLQAGSYGPFVVSINGGGDSAPSNTVSLLDPTELGQLPTPDLTPLLYARPSTIYGTSPVTVVMKVMNLTSTATQGLITLKLTKDARVSLSLTANATQVGSRPVQNGQWQLSDADPDYYVLTTSQVLAGNGVLSVGLEGRLSPGATTGQLTLSAVVLGGGEARLTNNIDADKIDYFQN